MSNPGRLGLWTAVIVVMAMGTTSAVADGGDECFAKRAKTPAEKKAAQDIQAALKSALPAAPRDWKLVDMTAPRKAADVVFTTSGCAEPHSIKAIYRNDRNALAAAQGMSANAGRMDKIMEEFQAAMAKGDTRRINELNAEMARLQSGGAAGGGAGGGSMTSVSIEVNNRSMSGPDARAQPLEIPGVPLAYLNTSGPEPRVTMYLGQSWQPQGKGASLRLRKDVANTEAQMIYISVAGGSAEQFARLIDIAALKAVLK